MKMFAAVLCLIVVGCQSQESADLDSKIVCSLDGHAYAVRPYIGRAVFLRRTVDADSICARAREAQ